jgi:hypothetical protein
VEKEELAKVRVRNAQRLKNQALLLLALGMSGERGSGGMFEDLTDALVRLGGALEVFDSTNLLAHILGLLRSDWLLRSLMQFFNCLLIVAEILLAADEDDGETLAEVQHLRNPLFLNVVERVGRINGETDQDDVGVRVRQWAQTIVILLSGGIPKSQFNMFSVHLDICNIILEDGGHIDLREGSLGENDEKTSLSTGTITNDDELATYVGHC